MVTIRLKGRPGIPLLTVLMVLMGLQGNAQQTVSGRVAETDAEEGLPGVTIQIKGTDKGTFSDMEGKFSIEVPDTNATLVLTSIGYITQELKVGSRNTFDIAMDVDVELLDEFVKVGYGTRRKEDLTGAVGSVDSKAFEEAPVTRVEQALQGRVAGVQVQTASGAPGGSTKIRIRGAGSMRAGNSPLIVVDGVQMNIGLNEINVNDVENMEVLKDASATAIYGSRGANGVILITTKSGSADTTTVEFTTNVGFSKLANKYDLANAAEFANAVEIYRPNYFNDEELAAAVAGPTTDWQDEIFQGAVSQDYQIAMRGGSDKVRYFASANHLNQTGIVIGSQLQKNAVRTNLSADLNDKLTMDLNFYGAKMTSVNSGDNGSKTAPVMGALFYSPTFTPYNDEGVYNRLDNLASPNAMNPVMQLLERNDDFASTPIMVNGKLQYEVMDGLTLTSQLGVNSSYWRVQGYTNEWMNPSQTSAYIDQHRVFTWQNSNIVNYKKDFGSIHSLEATGVFEQNRFQYSGMFAGGSDIAPISVGYHNLGIAEAKNAGSYMSQNSLRSYVGRVSYDLMDKYLFTATYRADGTSKFQGDNKWGFFPSAAVAWKAKEEKFLKDVDFISGLKVRGSWGQTGNEGINAYATVAQIGTTFSTFGTETSYVGSTVTGADNPNLKWETTAQTNAGVDFAVLDDRVTLVADVYLKRTTDMLHGIGIPGYYGAGVINVNIGEMENKGYELAITGVAFDRDDFKWTSSFNVSQNKNLLVSLGTDTMFLGGNYAPGLTQESPFVIKTGQSLGSFWGYQWMGIWSEAEAEDAALLGFKAGDNKYLDYNNDGVIDSQDKHIIGNALPKAWLGLHNSVQWKDFSLDIMIQGATGHQVLNTAYAASTVILSDATSITHRDGLDFWQEDNTDAMFANPRSSSNKNFIASTQFLQDASFVKLRNVTLTYTIDRDILKYGELRASIGAQNLYTLTNYKGYDPEASTSGGSDTDGGIDVGAFPTARTLTFGLQATF